MGDGNPFFRNWPTRYSGRLLLTAHCSTLRFAKFIGQLVGRKGNQDGLRKGALLPSGKRQAGAKAHSARSRRVHLVSRMEPRRLCERHSEPRGSEFPRLGDG
jgi:hypothetical protein